MNSIDLIIVSAYLIGLFGWAIYIGLGETAEDFLIFSRRAPFILVLFSIVSTWVGVGTTVVTAASAYETGISLGLTACIGGICGAIGAAVYAPQLKAFGDKYNAHTIGDFFRIRYGRISALAAGILILTVYLLLTAAQLVGMASLLSVWTGKAFEIIIIFAAVSTVIYTAFAGIKSDFYTDGVHFLVMFIVIFLMLLPISLHAMGGVRNFAQLPSTFFNPLAYGGVAFFIAGILFGGASVFVTMELWQRIYASSSGRAARWALGISILLIVAFYAVSTLLGLCAKILLPSLDNKDHALFALMKTYLPAGWLGLGLAGFIAVFLSTLNSMIMVASATLTKDLWFNWTPEKNRNSRNILIVGRLATFLCGTLGLLIALALPDLVALSVNGMFMLLILLPAVIGGLFLKRPTACAASCSVIGGIAVTLLFLTFSPNTAFVPGFLASLIVYVIASFATVHSTSENLNVVEDWNS
jgi:solute:Na+ symporter, SSS family